MPMIELSLSLNVHHTCSAPQAWAWLDLQPEQGLSSEVELPLWLSGKHEWRGRFVVDEARCPDFAYRVGLFAHAEAEWFLSFRSCHPDAELMADCDRLASAKAWLIGSCSVRVQPSASSDTTSRKDRNAPKFILLQGGTHSNATPT